LKRSPAEQIVDFLSFSPEASYRALDLSPQGWHRAAQWLDDSGLGFYLLQRAKDRDLTNAIPDSILSVLQANFAANQQRTDFLLRRFEQINRNFNEARVRYVVLKGFSLVPEFCPSSTLRHQGDLDYLVDESSLSAAQQALISAGYTAKSSRSSKEFIFMSPGATSPSRNARQYSPEGPHAVELHLDAWDSNLYGLPCLSKLISPERAKNHRANGLTFAALDDADAFLLQVLHASHHLFTHWIRKSSLLEIGYFIHRRADDTELWKRVAERIGNNIVLRELSVVITQLVAGLFAIALPTVIREWGATLRLGLRVWGEEYSREWAISDFPVYEFALFPKSKFTWFLQQQFEDLGIPAKQNNAATKSSSRIWSILQSLREHPSVVFDADWRRRQMLLRRTAFHALANLRYFCEIPRWRRLNLNKMQELSQSSFRTAQPRVPGELLDSN
jgi:hypothetical protein